MLEPLQKHRLVHLDLDSIGGSRANRGPALSEAIAASLRQFLAEHEAWIIEGCYGELIEAATMHCTELIFLNPGLAGCLANNRRRPWEPHKYASIEQQDTMLEALQAWVADYYTRTGPWSYQEHRRIFDSYTGRKVEYAGPEFSTGRT